MQTPVSFMNLIQKAQDWTYNLQKEGVLEDYRMQGFNWVRRIPQRFECMVRNPTIGCYVELYKMRFPGCVHIDSRAGKKLIQRYCYF